MTDIDQYYESKYILPYCTFCKRDYLTYNTYMVYWVELFCNNEDCEAFVKCFWVKKSELENRQENDQA